MITSMSEQQMVVNHQTIYFSQQCCLSLYCGLHALNNLYGRQQFTITNLNNICYSLSNDCINPHKHIFGGEYDANVLIKALQQKGNEVKWHDNRKQVNLKTINNQIIESNRRFRGLLLNNRIGNWFISCLFRTSARHWVAIKRISGKYVILDSARKEMVWMEEEELESYLNGKIRAGSELMTVIK